MRAGDLRPAAESASNEAGRKTLGPAAGPGRDSGISRDPAGTGTAASAAGRTRFPATAEIPEARTTLPNRPAYRRTASRSPPPSRERPGGGSPTVRTIVAESETRYSRPTRDEVGRTAVAATAGHTAPAPRRAGSTLPTIAVPSQRNDAWREHGCARSPPGSGPRRLSRAAGGRVTDCTRSKHASPMLDRPHPGELVRESMDEVRWNVPEAAAPLAGARGHPLAPAERQGRAVRDDGAGRPRLRDSRSLDPHAGQP